MKSILISFLLLISVGDYAQNGAEQKVNDKYKEVISKADNFFKVSDWSSAKIFYNQALEIKPQEVYPKIQIQLCDQGLKKKFEEQSLDVKNKKMASLPDTLKDIFYIIDTSKTGAMIETKRNNIILGSGEKRTKHVLPDSIYQKYTGVYFEEGFKNDTVKIMENEMVSFNSVLTTTKDRSAGNCIIRKGMRHLCKFNNKVFYFTTDLNYDYLRMSYMNGEMIMIFTNRLPLFK